MDGIIYDSKAIVTKMDDEPIENSMNPVSSGGLYSYLNSKYINKSQFVDNIDMKQIPLIAETRSGYVSSQGMCVVENKYVVVCRYYQVDSESDYQGRALLVYDIVSKTYLGESRFTRNQLGHVNSLSYFDGFIYVSTGEQEFNYAIVKLKINLNTFEITYDSIAFQTSDYLIYSFAINSNYSYFIGYSNLTRRTVLCKFENFENIVELTTIVTKSVYDESQDILGGATQGLAVDDEFIYVPLSGKIGSSSDYSLSQEIIIVYNQIGEIVTFFKYSRGSYGELEDVDIVTFRNSKYILINTNVSNFAYNEIFSNKLYTFCEPVRWLEPFRIDSGTDGSNEYLNLYVDGSVDDPFAIGSQNRPFSQINYASLLSNRFMRSTKIYASNINQNYIQIYQNIAKIIIVFVGENHINRNMLLENSKIQIESDSSTSGYVTVGGTATITDSELIVVSGLKFVGQDSRIDRPILAYRSTIRGDISMNNVDSSKYRYILDVRRSSVNLSLLDNDNNLPVILTGSSGTVYTGYSTIVVNNNLYGLTLV